MGIIIKKLLIKIFLNFFLILLACLPQAYAIIDIDIYIKPEFFTGDTIQFNYTIDSDFGQTINYMEMVDCPSAPHAMLDPKSAFVNLGINIHGRYNYLKVTEDIIPQECTASIVVLDPVQKVVSKPFTIVTTSPFDFDLVLNKKIFVKGEKIKIDYESEVDNPVLETFLTYPDKTRNEITLPYTFKADKIGTYKLEVSASKTGYKKVSLAEQFGVVKENADIRYANLAAEGLIIKNHPGLINSSFEVDSINKTILYIIYILVGLIILIIIFEIIKKVISKIRQSIYFNKT